MHGTVGSRRLTFRDEPAWGWKAEAEPCIDDCQEEVQLCVLTDKHRCIGCGNPEGGCRCIAHRLPQFLRAVELWARPGELGRAGDGASLNDGLGVSRRRAQQAEDFGFAAQSTPSKSWLDYGPKPKVGSGCHVQLVATFHACKLHPLPPPPAMTIAPPPAEGTLCVELVGCAGLAGFKGQSTAGLTSDDDTYVKLALQVCGTGTPATHDRMSTVTRRSQIGGAHPRMEARQSHICRRTSAPRFKQTFRFSITANDLDLGVDFTLHATVYDSMAIGADNFRGETAFSVGEALGAAGSQGWLRHGGVASKGELLKHVSYTASHIYDY